MCKYMRYRSQCVRCGKALGTEDVASRPCKRMHCARTLGDIEAEAIVRLELCDAYERSRK
jgi:hypothetical protein